MERKWITASCFCPIENWQVLLKAIKQFVCDLPEDDFLFFQVKFNYDNGYNIRCSILTIGEKYNAIAIDLDQRLTGILDLLPKEKQEKIASISLPFPTFTLQFGLYNLFYKDVWSDRYRVQQLISNLVFDAFEDFEITNDAIIVFAFYLQLELTKTCLTYFKGNPNDVLSSLLPQPGSASNDQNFDTMHEIAMDVMEQNIFDNELSWLNLWSDFCSSELSKKAKSMEDSITQFHKKNVSIIFEQLGIEKETKDFLSGAMNYSLRKLK
jgi:hypothetical protein